MKKDEKTGDRCPNCGFCPHCGQSAKPRQIPFPYPVYRPYYGEGIRVWNPVNTTKVQPETVSISHSGERGGP